MSTPPQPSPVRNCHACGKATAAESFCGSCGSALDIEQYIISRVDAALAKRTHERDLIERESAVKVFERAFGWMKMVLGIFVAVAALIAIPLGAIGISKWSDLVATITAAKNNVLDVSSRIHNDIESASKKARGDVAGTVESARSSIAAQAIRAKGEAVAATQTAIDARNRIRVEHDAVQNDLRQLRGQVQSASQLEPQITIIRGQLRKAVEDIQKTQKTLSNSEEFAKSIFSSVIVQT